MGCGPVWEAINFAAMDQYTQLWEEGYKGGLPIIFNFFNNQYGMGGQTMGETMGYNMLARVGAGVNPDQLHAERVDGYNPLAVIDATRRKKELIESGKAPVLLDVVTYRLTGHSPSDAGSYRTKEEVDMWTAEDCVQSFGKKLIEAGIASAEIIKAVNAAVKERMTRLCGYAADYEISPRFAVNGLDNLMFSNQRIEKMEI